MLLFIIFKSHLTSDLQVTIKDALGLQSCVAVDLLAGQDIIGLFAGWFLGWFGLVGAGLL